MERFDKKLKQAKRIWGMLKCMQDYHQLRFNGSKSQVQWLNEGDENTSFTKWLTAKGDQT